MKKRSLIPALSLVLALAACSSDDAVETGSIRANIILDENLAQSLTSVTLAIESANRETSFTEWEDGFVSTNFRDLTPGDYDVRATGYAGDSTESVAAASVTATVRVDRESAVVLTLGSPLLAGLSASSASPMTAETVTLTASPAVSADEAITYQWSDDCRGTFTSRSGAEVTWTNQWAESCSIRVKAFSAAGTDTASLSLSTRYATGTLETFAGTNCAFEEATWGEWNNPLIGEGGPAVKASIGNALGVRVGPDDNVYFTDRENGRVLMVDDDGILHRIAGRGEGHDAELAGDGGPARDAVLYWPVDLDFDAAGNLFILDYWNGAVRRVTAETQVISSMASLNGHSLVATPEGDVYSRNRTLYFVDGETGERTTVEPAGLSDNTGGMTIGPDGTIVIGDRDNHQVKLFYPADQTTAVIAGSGVGGYAGDGGPALDAEFDSIMSVRYAPSGKLYVVDGFNAAVRAIDAQGNVETVLGRGHGTFAGRAGVIRNLGAPRGIDFDADGNMYLGDRRSCRVSKITGPW